MKHFLLKFFLTVAVMAVGISNAFGVDVTKCTSTEDLVAGDVYYISGANTYDDNESVMAMNTGGNNFPQCKFSEAPVELILGGNATDGWTFSYTDGDKMYYLDPTNTTGNNHLKRNENLTNYGKFSISFGTENSNAVITSKGKDSKNIIRYNSTSSLYSCYSSGQDNIYLYKKRAPLTSISIKSNPVKTEYIAGEKLDLTGLNVFLNYSDGTSIEMKYKSGSELTSVPAEWTTLNTSNENVTISYKGFSTSFPVLVASEAKTCTARFSVYGEIEELNNFTAKTNTSITFPSESALAIPEGKIFIGWTKEEINGAQDSQPILVSPSNEKIGLSDVTYFAVLAREEEIKNTYNLTNEEIKGSKSQGSYGTISITSGSGTWTGKAIVNTATGFVQINKNKNNYNICTPKFNGAITSITINTCNSTAANRKFYLMSDNLTAQPTSGTNGLGSISSANGSVTISATGEKSQLYIYTDAVAYISSISVTVTSLESKDYCTSPGNLSLVATDGDDYYATFSNPRTVQFTDATAYTVSIEDNKLTLNEVADNKVPANTGVVVKTSGTNASYDYIASVAAIEGNLLKPASEEMTDDDYKFYKFYKLAYGDWTNKTGLGFYWGAAEGGTFTCKAGTAYLAVPTSAGASEIRGFSFDDLENGNETAIPEIDPTGEVPLIIYTMTGIRIPKVVEDGLYIVNGKTKWMIAE